MYPLLASASFKIDGTDAHRLTPTGLGIPPMHIGINILIS